MIIRTSQWNLGSHANWTQLNC